MFSSSMIFSMQPDPEMERQREKEKADDVRRRRIAEANASPSHSISNVEQTLCRDELWTVVSDPDAGVRAAAAHGEIES